MRWILAGLVACLGVSALADEVSERRTGYLEELLRWTPESKAFSEWLAESGELPPDFESMPSSPGLPDLLMTGIGPEAAPITTPAEWEAHRAVLKAEFERWITGSVPPRPDNLTAEVLLEEEIPGGIRREVVLRFGPDHAAKLWAEVLVPAGDGPFPVFMTQANHHSWARIALQRGYIAVSYAGADSRDDTDSFITAYPEYDWSKLMRRGWAASRCIDYLESMPEADVARVALTGHSRNGKTSLMGSAFDERIAVVISSSSGAGGCAPTRLFSEHDFGEGVELISRNFPDWFHPRWRFFTGREDKLPIDFHQLVALSAPRPCLIATATHDGVENIWAIEQMVHRALRVYDLLGAPENLRIDYRPGGHGTWPATIERYLDWCDVHFGRGSHDFPEAYLYPHDWEGWSKAAGIREIGDDAPLHARMEALLGVAPPKAPSPRHDYGLLKDHEKSLLKRNTPGAGLSKEEFVFGEYINADVYYPRGLDEGEKLPCILWLHPACTSHGYTPAYLHAPNPYETWARAGYAVFCYDQTGHGGRIEELRGFYQRYPQWSILGKMVRDAQSALDAIGTLPYVDTDRIYVVGYSVGALAGLHLGALDDRVDGLIALAPPAPWGAAHGNTLAYWGVDTLLIPQLGFYAAQPSAAPYDLDELAAAMNGRPSAIITPKLGWTAQAGDYSASGVPVHVPDDYNRLTLPMQSFVLEQLVELE
jgi:dienelactone hydrolase